MTRRAIVRTTHDEPAVVAAALEPDHTDEMSTAVEGSTVVTRIERETTGGLHATVDDYVVNLDVAETIVQHATDANRDTIPTDDRSTGCSPSDAEIDDNE